MKKYRIVIDTNVFISALRSKRGASYKREIFYLWRPILKDPNDDMVLELAVESESDYILTYNKKDFLQSISFGIERLTPKEFLEILGEL
ncbi:MAG: PIN domain-containing protein [Desulfamplus sp.]|nr:PIN domain-containing protein [Desulfamplus sp.]